MEHIRIDSKKKPSKEKKRKAENEITMHMLYLATENKERDLTQIDTYIVGVKP